MEEIKEVALVAIEELTNEDCRALYWDDGLEGFEKVAEGDLGSGRWVSYHYMIVKELSTGKLYQTNFEQGFTEDQDIQPFESGSPSFFEVEAVEKTIVVTNYVRKEYE